MRTLRMYALFLGVALCGALFIAATQDQQNDGTFMHDIIKGETLSLICIDYYGHYSGLMGDAIMKLNPTMKSVNAIYAGQKLRLKEPEQPAAAAAANTPLFEKTVDATQGVVTYVEGKATIIPSSSHAKTALVANTLVYPGDVIETAPRGRVEIIINRESVVRLDENTRLTMQMFRESSKEKGVTSLKVNNGTLWTKMKKFADKVSRFQLELPTAIAGVHGTVYQTAVAADSSSEIKVFDGEVAVSGQSVEGAETAGPYEVPGPHEVSMDEWTQIVQSMQKMKVGKDGKAGEPESFAKNSNDAWEKWNDERDCRIAAMFQEIGNGR
jgi:hypothetical protein